MASSAKRCQSQAISPSISCRTREQARHELSDATTPDITLCSLTRPSRHSRTSLRPQACSVTRLRTPRTATCADYSGLPYFYIHVMYMYNNASSALNPDPDCIRALTACSLQSLICLEHGACRGIQRREGDSKNSSQLVIMTAKVTPQNYETPQTAFAPLVVRRIYIM